MIFTHYYEVSGERVIMSDDGKNKHNQSKRTRFESVSLYEAEQFATAVFKKEGIVCEIHEVRR